MQKSAGQFDEKIDNWVEDILSRPKNIATELELREQAKVAINLFFEADIDGSDHLSFEELKSLCDMAGLPMENDEEEALIKMDRDDSGTLDLEEWVTWWLSRISTLPNPIKQQEAIARNTFGKFDIDSSGYLDCSELRNLTSALGANFSEDEMQDALTEIDSDGSGMIEVNEFIAWWTNRASANRNNTSLISLKMRKLALKAAQVFSTDIFAAAWNGDVELVKAFLVGEARLAQATDSSEYGEGWTALHYACYQGHAAVVQALLGSRPDINRTNDMGFSALFYAAQRGHIYICELLMDAGADPTITGVYQPIGLLESDGPPPLATGNPATAAPAEPSQPPEIFMCPVEHILDYPELRPIFKSSSKCAVPQAPDYDKVTASLSLATGILSFEVKQPQKAFSQLPVKQWEMKVRMDMQMDTDLVPAEIYADLVSAGLTLVVRLPAVHPKQQHSYTAQLDRVWVRKLHFLCTLHKLKRLQLLEASLAGLEGLWSELSAMYGSIDASYRSGISLIDFVYILINKCPDRKNTKELRHGLRAALEQVTINNNNINNSNSAATHDAAATAPSPKKPLAKRGVSESKEQDSSASSVDLTDPVAKVNAALKEMQIRKAAAEQVRRAQQQQVEEERASKGAAAGSTKTAAVVEDPAAAPSDLEVKWSMQAEDRAGFPTVALSLSAVNNWGAGDFSSSISVNILTNKSNRTVK